MAQEIYKLGDIQFDTKEQLLAASSDLKRINELMKSHDTKNPDEAKILLDMLENEPGFSSDYGAKFVEKLKKTANVIDPVIAAPTKPKSESSHIIGDKVKNTAEAKKVRESKKEPVAKKKRSGAKIHLLTRRNIIIVAVIAVIAATVSVLFATGIIPKPETWLPGMTAGENEASTHRNLVLQYAKNQLTLREEMISYYKKSQAMSADKAKTEANNVIANSYALNLADESVPSMSDSEIEETYKVLMLKGDIEAGGFNEPEAITQLKETMKEAAASGVINTNPSIENLPNTGEADVASKKIVLLNQMLDYQERLSIQFACDYNHYKFKEDEVAENVSEDMEKLFSTPIYNAVLPEDENAVLSDEEKKMYYDSYAKAGLIDANGPVRFNSSPAYYALPDLTSQVNLNFKNGFSATTFASQQTSAPKAQVTYEFLGANLNGYVTFRANGSGSDYIQDDEGNTVVVQGDLYMILDNQVTIGSWYVNAGKIGILVDDTRFGEIECVYNIKY